MGTSCARDNNGHGTHCAGTIAGKTFGVAKEAIVHAVKVLGYDGRGSNAGIIEAIDFVTAEGLRPAVISMSLGCSAPCQSRSEASAIAAAVRAGVTVVVAAGNSGNTNFPDACDYAPASIPQAITVGSITINNDQRSSFSNIGNCIDIFAPGSQIFSAGPGSDQQTRTLSGTSMACPHVSGAAALALGQNPQLTPQKVTELIVGGASAGKVRDARGSPNKLLFIRNLGAPSSSSPPPPSAETGFKKIQSGTCADIGMEAINDPSVCETAAVELNLVDTTVAFTDSVPRPEGCYLFFGDQLAFATNRANAGTGAVGPREPICKQLVPATTPAPTPVPTQAPTPVPVTSAPTPVPETSAPTPPSARTPFKKIQSGTCADIGMEPIKNPSICEAAAVELNLVDVTVSFTNSVPRPEGCYLFEGRLLAFARNGANAGIGAVGPREPICKELGAMTTPVPTPVPADQIRFVAEISEGTCSDVNGIPINDEDICELAARVLGIPDTTATKTNGVPRPEGCYVFRGNGLFMGVNAQNKGRGAETSRGLRSRHPICGFTQ